MKRYLVISVLLLAASLAGAQTTTRHAGAGTGGVLSTHPSPPACDAAIPPGQTNTCKFTLTKPCGPRPATETQVQQCAAPLTGSWTQTKAYGAHATRCWVAGAWTPSTPPAGACTTAPVVVPPPPPPPPAVSELPTVNLSAIPTGSPGFADVRIRQTGELGYRDPDGTGAFRTVCEFSHMNFDDAIVFPGRRGASHLHAYFGNTIADATTTPANLLTRGNSTCRGGIANRSAYWVPAMIDTRDGTPVRPRSANIYYKTGYQGNVNSAIRTPPPGLRMIAGDSKATTVGQAWATHIEYGCNGGGSQIIPNCAPGAEVEMHINFPQCWDGVNLDAPDHKSHMAFGSGSGGCPSTHPVPLPAITVIAIFPVVGQNSSTWRLSSDRNGAPAGSSGHGDWMNGWGGQTPDEYLPDVFVRRLLNPGLSGGSHMLGDGRAMY